MNETPYKDMMGLRQLWQEQFWPVLRAVSLGRLTDFQQMTSLFCMHSSALCSLKNVTQLKIHQFCPQNADYSCQVHSSVPYAMQTVVHNTSYNSTIHKYSKAPVLNICAMLNIIT